MKQANTKNTTGKAIALEGRLRGCRNVVTLGVRPNFSDYPSREADLVRRASKIYFPSPFYAGLFDAMGKETFPSYHTYKCVQDKIKQTALFELLELPHPRTRAFYGPRQKKTITEYFRFPFVGKIPRGSARGRGVCLIRNPAELGEYLKRTDVAYIQEYLETDRDVRVVVIGTRAVLAYWRIAPPNEFRSNVALGGRVSPEGVPPEVVELALHTAGRCRWNHVGLDFCHYKDRWYVIEANMKYGMEGFHQAGIDYNSLMEGMIDDGEI